jgi:hypothetical protein
MLFMVMIMANIDADLLSLETLIATQQAAKWTCVAAIAACASCLITLIGIGVALKSLHQWKPQYRENARLRFMDALVQFEVCLILLPKNLEKDEDFKHRKTFMIALSEVNARGLIYLKDNPNEELSKYLKNLRERSAEFIGGKVYKSELALISNIILLMKL